MKRSGGDRILLFLFVLVTVAVVVGTLVPGAGRWLPFYAPLATHLGAFVLVGIFARLALPGSCWVVPDALMVAITFGIVLESLQLLVPTRTFYIFDLVANVAGSLLGVLVAGRVLAILAKRRRDRRSCVQATEPD